MSIILYMFPLQIVAEGGPIIVSSAFAHSSNETTKVRPDLPEVDVKVGMTVLARRRAMLWQRGKVLEIVTKGTR